MRSEVKSFDAEKLRQKVEDLPLAHSGIDEGAPAVQPPSLDGLRLVVPEVVPVSQEELWERHADWLRSCAEVRYRGTSERLSMGDDVLVDLVARADGKLIPFSARTNLWMQLLPEPMLPGLCERIAQSTVGASLSVAVTFPSSYPVERLRGLAAQFSVEVKGARQLALPDAENASVLASFGRGETPEEVMQSLLEEMEDERRHQAWLEAQSSLLTNVAAKAKVTIPPEKVDEEIRGRWMEAEGRGLMLRGFSREEQAQALEGWLTDSETRADAEQRLRISYTLKAICERDGVRLARGQMEEILANVLEPYVSLAEVQSVLSENPVLLEQVRQLAWQVMAVEYVVARAEVEVSASASKD